LQNLSLRDIGRTTINLSLDGIRRVPSELAPQADQLARSLFEVFGLLAIAVRFVDEELGTRSKRQLDLFCSERGPSFLQPAADVGRDPGTPDVDANFGQRRIGARICRRPIQAGEH
jgi:hypothetical protein